jgi:hypothetical protein
MSEVLWLNIPLMVAFFGLMAGVPLWFVLRRHEWHHKPEGRTVPGYLVERRAARVQRTPEPTRYSRRLVAR